MRTVLFFIFCFCASLSLDAKQLQLEIKAKSAILINGKNGHILFEKNAHDKSFPASTTKIATALYILEKGQNLDRLAKASSEALTYVTAKEKTKSHYTYPAYWLEPSGVSFDLKKGEKISMRALLYGAMLCSGNDAANVLAENEEGSIPHFMDKLNAYLKTLGCENTHFCNPHGLHHPNHFTTVYDMALIAKRAMQLPLFRQIVKSTSANRPKTNMQPAKYIKQFNGLLLKNKEHYYPYAIGIKTGYHSQAKNTLVAAAEKDGRFLIAVVFGCETSEQRYKDVKKLFKKAFEEPFTRKVVLQKNETNFKRKIRGGKTFLNAYLKDDVVVNIYPSEDFLLKAFVHWRENLSLPIEENQKVGEVWIETTEKELILQQPIFAKSGVQPTIFAKTENLFKKMF